MGFVEASQRGSYTGWYSSSSRAIEPGGPHWTYRFANGYGASIIPLSGRPYVGFEIAVLDEDDNIVYDTPVTDDVAYANSFAAVDVLLEAIYDLPPARYNEAVEGREGKAI